MEKELNFAQRTSFPGTTGNPFDVVLHKFGTVEIIPAVVFGALLLVLAAPAGLAYLPSAAFLWLFFLIDWLLLALLPKFGISFGPSKPPALLLAGMRLVVALLTGPLSWVFQVIGTALVIYAFWLEPMWLKVTRQQLVTDKLPAGFSIKILHLGDLHIERPTRREAQVTRQIAELKPDLILFSGDILNLSYLHDPAAHEAARAHLRTWQAPLGTFLVSGSPAVDLAEVLPGLLEGLPVTRLSENKVTISHQQASFDLVGLDCSHRPHIDGPVLESLLSPAPPARFTILLYHTPDLAPAAARLGVDLQLSGHTHGGQIRLPGYGALFSGSLYGKRFENGRRMLEKMTLYVTQGIGLEGAAAPRVRFLCRPEIILWEISGSSPA